MSKSKEKKKSNRCWVILWEGNQFAKDFIEILPKHWNPKEVENYLIGLYYNSPALLMSERLNKIKTFGSKKACTQALVVRQGSTIIVGDNPFLVACEVEDFEIVHQQDKGIEVLSYTRPPGQWFNKDTGSVEQAGSATKVQFERKYAEIWGVLAQSAPGPNR